MKISHYISSFIFLFLLFTRPVNASHVVGGTLTYIHNGGSSYTITLKLFRDCGPGTWSFPNSVDIQVLGNNGAAFSPSKNITMNLGTVTVIPSTLGPCAIAPDPVPCVQEGIYTKTVTNLPPNDGGYHLYWQVEARNVSITNVNTTCNCIGASFYAYIPGPWYEDFDMSDNTTSDNGTTSWSITNGSPAPSSAAVNNNKFEITGANSSSVTWNSQLISIASCSNVNVSVNLEERGTLESNDSIKVYYRLNGGPLTLFPANGSIADDFTNALASVAALNGNTIQIVIRVSYGSSSPSSEIYRFDNVRVSCSTPNSSPAFNLFPPIFICAGQPFTFDHSATDINGDSLAYSFYTPYNGDNNSGSLDPTFSQNTAVFEPITWQPGYSATNPLGGTALTLNPATGLLTGTANTLGQYVVGVMVKEYRNGVLIGQTLRDFQFNVVNCPVPPLPTAGPDITINMGCTAQISSGGFNPATVIWTSVAPGATGAYNNYLSCTSGCANPTVSPIPGAPSYIDFQVCGLSVSCSPTNTCDVVRVFFEPALSVSITPVNPIICPGQTSLTLTATGGGGTPPYSFLWNNLNPSQNIVVGTGTYTVLMSDVSGCPPVQATVNVTSDPITANAGTDQTVCKQSPATTINGTVTSASGGVWTGGNGVFSPNNTTLSGATYTPTSAELTAGFVNLTLTTTGNGSCSAVSDVVRINYVDFTGSVSVTSTPVSCFGGNDGTAGISISGGSPPYIYAWNTVPASTSASVNNLSIGTYTVTTKNNLGCTITNTVTVTQPTTIALNGAVTDIACPGGNNGSISVTASGGTSPYTYLWQPGNQTTSSITNLGAGTYTVTVKDVNLCSTTTTYTISQPSPVIVNLAATPVSCYNGSNGTASSTVSGGTSPYTYTWSSGATSPNASGLPIGTYTLTVKDTKGCTSSNAVTISQPPPFTVSINSTAETCNTLDNGTATATPAGGTPSYTYLWQPGAYTASTLTGIASGTYTLTVTDAKGCTAVSNTVITEPPPLTINFISQSNVNCKGGNDGSVTANPVGGTPGYSYLWTPGGNTTAKISSLAAGSYTVTVTDSKGCTSGNAVVIPEPPQLIATAGSTDETCDYLNNGTANVIASGGTPGYTYLWQPNLQTTATASGLKAASYTVTVTDVKGCTASAFTTVNQPAPIVLTIFSQTDVSCYGGTNGSATASTTGGTPGFSYVWSPGNNTTANAVSLSAGKYSLTVIDANGCNASNSVQINEPSPVLANVSTSNGTCSGAVNGNASSAPTGGSPGYTYLWQPGAYTTASVSNLSVGTYSLNLTDTKGCTTTTLIQISEPLPLSINFTSQKNVSCYGGNDGSVSVNIAGGTANYTYAWMPGGATTNSISNIAAGTYSVTVTDSKGCNATASVTITQPVLLTANATSTNETCDYLNNGTAVVTAAGGTAGYTYLWQPDLQTTANAAGLKAATYTVTVTDSKGCTSTATTAVNQPPPLNVSFASQNVSCFAGNDGSTTANPTGGTAGYTYLWVPGGNTTATKNSLTAGTYSVTVTDSKGCTTTNQVNITQPITLAVSTTKTNESCNYLNNGTATAQPAGGTPAYSYLWTPGGGTTAIISNLAANTYSVTITDAEGCTATASTVVGEPAPLSLSFNSQINVSCFGSNDGSVSVSPSGGTANYSYTWMPGGATTNGISNIAAGTYSVTVTDANGCTVNNSVTIIQPSSPLSVTVSATPASCYGINDGTASANATGGTGPYTYTWAPGSLNGATITNLAADTYTITITDALGCTATNTIVVNQPAKIVLTTASSNSDCGQANGKTSVAVTTGGVGPFSYLWSPGGGTNDTAVSLLSGAYTVLVTDANGCQASQWGNVNENSSPSAIIFSVMNVSCYGGSDGSASVVATGGLSPYTYSWSPAGGTDSVANGLSAGTYTVTVTGSNGCQSVATTSPEISQPPPLDIVVSKTSVSCFGANDGTASAVASGGSPGYMYEWLPGNIPGTNINGLSATTYTIQVTDTKNCVAQKPVAIIQPPVLAVSLFSSPISCFGGNDGTVSASALGGTVPYSYSWMPGNISGPNAGQLAADTYTVTITDAKGCGIIDSVTVTQPAVLTSILSSVNSNCGLANGQTSVAAGGGTPGYTYLWLPAGGTNITAASLLAGMYSVTVTDNNGCIDKDTVTVNNNNSPVATVSSVTHLTCNASNNGTATVSVTGGAAPYTYLWSPAGATGATATGLPSGTYTVTVTDANSCQSIPAVSAQITQPNPVFIDTLVTSVSCFGNNDGAITVNVTGGTPGYSYLWTPGGNTTAAISSLIAGSYTVQVTDMNNCIATKTITVTQPSPALSAMLASTPVNCFNGTDGTAMATASGGTSPYSYNWIPGNISGPFIGQLSAGTYTVTITDANGCSIIDSATLIQPSAITTTTTIVNSNCNVANGQASVIAGGGTPGYTYVWSPVGGTTNAANSLMAGIYYVEVTDNNGCIAKDTAIINNNSSPTAVVSATTNVTCNGSNNGTATATATGGSAPYTYLWSPSSATTATATGLAPGTYTVVVTDANLCQSSPAVSTEITEPYPVYIDTTVTKISCFGNNDGMIVANATGGTPSYSYLWMPGGNTTATLSNLSQNSYTVQVTDGNSCIQTATVVLTEPTLLSSSISATTHVNCYGENTGAATVSVTGGTPTYNYSWTPSGGNGPDGNGFAAGSYTVTITDDKGCSTLSSVTINQPGQGLSATSTQTAVSCFGTTDGTIVVQTTGGTPVYSYQWNPSVSSNDTATGLLPGNYVITVVDSNGCEANVAAAVNEPAAITGSLLPVNPSCSQANGSISTQLSGGTAPYTYLWQPTSASTSSISGLGVGAYNLTITDSSGCVLAVSATLTVTPDPIVAITNLKDVSCYGGNDGEASVAISQGTPPFSISWLPYGGFDTTAVQLDTGSYIVTITDALGCQANDTAIIAEPLPVDVTAASLTDVLCNGDATGSVTLAVTGGTVPYSYLWAPSGATTANASNLSIGTYSVTVSDQNNCSKAISMVINEPSILTAVIDSMSQPVCPSTTGTASVLASGGMPPYSYSWSAPALAETNSTAYNLAAGSYTVTVTDSNGCAATANVLLTAPTPVVTLAGSTDTLCVGQSGAINASASGGTGTYTYAWQPSGAVTSGTLTINPINSTIYTVVAYDQNGCPGNRDTIPVVVYDLTNANIDMFGDSPICPGMNTFIYATSSGDTGPLTYQWNNGLGTGPGGFLVIPPQPTTYMVTVTNVCGTSISDSIQVLFNPLPTIDLSLVPVTVCSPSLTLFDDNSVAGNPNDPIDTWLWDFGDGTQSTDEDPSHSYASPGNYLITLTVSTGGGCLSSNATSPFAITATPSPLAAFSMNSTHFDLPHEALILNNQSTGANSYLWNFGDGSSSTVAEPAYTYSSIGIFNVQLIAMNQFGCSDTTTAELVTDAEIIFPNAFTPNQDGSTGGTYDINDWSNDTFFPHTSGVVEYDLQIFNRWGELIFESTDVKKGWDGYYHGQLCQQDVYVWKAHVVLNNGRVFNKTGNVTLLY